MKRGGSSPKTVECASCKAERISGGSCGALKPVPAPKIVRLISALNGGSYRTREVRVSTAYWCGSVGGRRMEHLTLNLE